MLLHCKLGEMIFFLLTAFQDFNVTLKRDKMILMQIKQFHLDSLNKVLGLKVHKLFLLVTQLELLFGAAVRLVSFCFHFCLQSLLISPKTSLKQQSERITTILKYDQLGNNLLCEDRQPYILSKIAVSFFGNCYLWSSKSAHQ